MADSVWAHNGSLLGYTVRLDLPLKSVSAHVTVNPH